MKEVTIQAAMRAANVKAAKAKVMRIKPLRRSLKDWFDHKGRCPFPAIHDFGVWVELMLDFMGDMIHNDGLETADNYVAALRVQSMGDPLALKCARQLEKKGVQTDIDCYVEEGMVYASVWLKHRVIDHVNKLAEEVAGKFREKGYSVDVWTDEEDSSEVTVNAVIDFDKFAELLKKGGQ